MIDIEGIDRGHCAEFRGIRYAAADRLTLPDDIDGIEPGTDGTVFGAQAPQLGGALEKMLGATDLASDEDCLFLNIFTPSRDDAARPVLVFVHGGAFVTGTAAMPWYDGAALCERGDVVVVTINYRLGALGFLDDTNLGSHDQVSALRWIGRNISEFGGDPDNVTIFGESAGGSSVISLLAVPAAEGLFHKVWSMSPSITQYRSRAEAGDLTRRFLEFVGNDDLTQCSSDEILEAQGRFLSNVPGFRHFSPTEGSELFPGEILERAASDDRPLVVGTNRDEMLLFTAFDASRGSWTDADVDEQFHLRFGSHADAAVAAYRAARPNSDPSRLVSAMQTDETFRRPAQRLAEARAARGVDTWMYQFEMESTAFGGVLGACHGLDLPYAFDTLDSHGAELFTGPGEHRRAVAARLSGDLVAFARTGEVSWARFTLADRATRRIGPIDELVLDPEPELRTLWDRE